MEKIASGIYMLQTNERVCSTIYVLDGGKEGKLVIDSGDGEVALDFEPACCMLTHGHIDHTRGVKAGWKEVLLHPAERKDAPFIFIPPSALPLSVGKRRFAQFELEVFHTPGHTMGSVCMLERKSGCLFSGDTLFAGGEHGRTDLMGSDEMMAESLAFLEKLDYKLLCPGHDEIEERGK